MYSRINTCELLMNSLVKVETGNNCNGFVRWEDGVRYRFNLRCLSNINMAIHIRRDGRDAQREERTETKDDRTRIDGELQRNEQK